MEPGRVRTDSAELSWMSQSVKLTTALEPTYTPPPCKHEGQFMENTSIGALERGRGQAAAYGLQRRAEA